MINTMMIHMMVIHMMMMSKHDEDTYYDNDTHYDVTHDDVDKIHMCERHFMYTLGSLVIHILIIII